jgi:hypothetical protein
MRVSKYTVGDGRRGASTAATTLEQMVWFSALDETLFSAFERLCTVTIKPGAQPATAGR